MDAKIFAQDNAGKTLIVDERKCIELGDRKLPDIAKDCIIVGSAGWDLVIVASVNPIVNGWHKEAIDGDDCLLVDMDAYNYCKFIAISKINFESYGY